MFMTYSKFLLQIYVAICILPLLHKGNTAKTTPVVKHCLYCYIQDKLYIFELIVYEHEVFDELLVGIVWTRRACLCLSLLWSTYNVECCC